ncbi:MAG: IS1380 family transposase [Ferrovum sp.]|jgi:hypothetical protein|nr:IS1380 family transposase [Ferrovum sp.]
MVNGGQIRIKVDRTEEALTGQGGFLAFGEYLNGMKVRERVEQHLPAPGSNRGFAPGVFVQSLITLLSLGGQTLSDLRELEREKNLLALLGQTVIPDEDTVGQWLRRMGDPDKGEKGLLGLGKVRDEINREILSRDQVKDYTLDLDASFIESHKEDARYSYLNEKGYMPMMAAFYETEVFVDDEFREGNVSPQAGHVAVYRRGQALANSVGKTVARVRADSASYNAELINALTADGVQWTITADKNSAVMELIHRIEEKDWVPVTRSGSGEALAESCEVAETLHAMENTPEAFRLIVKRVRECSGTPLFPHMVSYRYWVVATNLGPEWSSKQVLLWHQLRGHFENFFKELKNGVGVGYMPTGDFHANAVFFRVGVLTYNLLIGFKRDLLPASGLTWKLQTIRWKIFSMAGRIVRHARSLVVKLAVGADSLAFLSRIRGQCQELFGSA